MTNETLFTPFHIEILFHYYTGARDFRDGDFSAPVVIPFIKELIKYGLIKINIGGEPLTAYSITNAGRAHIDRICAMVPEK